MNKMVTHCHILYMYFLITFLDMKKCRVHVNTRSTWTLFKVLMYICKGCFSGLVVGSYVTWDGLVRRRSCAFLKKGWAYNVWKGFCIFRTIQYSLDSYTVWPFFSHCALFCSFVKWKCKTELEWFYRGYM